MKPRNRNQIGAKFIQDTHKKLIEPEAIVLCHYGTESVLKRLPSGAVKRVT